MEYSSFLVSRPLTSTHCASSLLRVLQAYPQCRSVLTAPPPFGAVVPITLWNTTRAPRLGVWIRISFLKYAGLSICCLCVLGFFLPRHKMNCSLECTFDIYFSLWFFTHLFVLFICPCSMYSFPFFNHRVHYYEGELELKSTDSTRIEEAAPVNIAERILYYDLSIFLLLFKV